MNTSTLTREAALAGVSNVEARIAALAPFMTCGQQFIRRVRDEIAFARMAWEVESAGARIVTAEIAAGLRSAGDYLTRYEPTTYDVTPSV